MYKLNLKSKLTKSGQITIIEFSLLALLFSGVFFFFTVTPQQTSNSYMSYSLDTYLSSISKLDEIRQNVILENLSNISITEDWTSTLSTINLTLNKFELIISNNIVSKTIISCNSSNGIFFSSVFISSLNSTSFNPKTLTLGVCY